MANLPSLSTTLVCLCLAAMTSVFFVGYDRIMIPVTVMHNVRVVETVGEFDYWLEDANGQKLYAKFCDTLGYEPPFDKGETILLLKFRNRGTCWDMRDMHPKYIMDRDEHGNLIYKEN